MSGTTTYGSRSVAPLTEADLDRGVLPRFRDVVHAQPEAVAVSDALDELTYRRLAERAAGVLANLRAALSRLDPPPTRRGPQAYGAQEPVALLCGHDTTAVAALLAVLASGHPVVVLDERTPAPRLQALVARAGARLVVTDEAHLGAAGELAAEPVVAGGTGDAEQLWAQTPEPSAVAALAFTSGSTGAPKPVANDHRLFMQDAWNSSIASGCYDADDTLAHTLPIAFHAGLTTTVHGLVVGACMRLYDTRSAGIAGLPAFIAEQGCTVMISSPAILRAFCAAGPQPAQLAALRTLTIAGEAAYARDVQAAAELLSSRCVIRNRYGSSETGLIAEYIVTDPRTIGSGPLPIGRGVGWTRLDVVGEDGASADIGCTGRMTVTARHVALGYWELPEATAAAFRDHADGNRTYLTSDLGRRLPDGSIEIVGRVDHSVKIRGYLVDPGEVDAALFELPEVAEAVVTGAARPQGEGKRLVAYVVAARDGVTATSLRGALRAGLPAHMVPEAFVFLPRLPRTERGKIDRSALPSAPEASQVGRDEALTHWEELVAVLWADVLEREVVHLDDDFFAIGGDSLAAEALMSRVVDDLGVPAEVATSRLLVEAPTLREFAARLQGNAPAVGRSLVTLQPEGDETPVFFIAGGGGLGLAFVPLARRLGPGRPSYAIQSPILEGRGLPEFSVRSIARHHLRTLRRVRPHGPYHLAGHSFGGLVALEMAHLLRASGEQVASLTILDSFPPDPGCHPDPPAAGPLRRARAALGLLRASLRSTTGGSEAWRFFDQSGYLGRRYHGRPWEGLTLVCVAETQEAGSRAAWEPFLTGRWQRVQTPGDHFTMIRPPAVDDLAVHVRAVLRDGDAATGRAR